MSLRAGSCYKFVETYKNWYAARADCQIQGGDLAQITTTHKAHQMQIVRSQLGELCFINLTAELPFQFVPSLAQSKLAMTPNFSLPMGEFLMQIFAQHKTLV